MNAAARPEPMLAVLMRPCVECGSAVLVEDFADNQGHCDQCVQAWIDNAASLGAGPAPFRRRTHAASRGMPIAPPAPVTAQQRLARGIPGCSPPDAIIPLGQIARRIRRRRRIVNACIAGWLIVCAIGAALAVWSAWLLVTA